MKITEWLTPGLFDLNTILITLMMCWTVFAIVSNFLEDFHIPPRWQSANYLGVILMTLAYLVELVVLEPVKTLYPNPYDWLLVGTVPVLLAIIFGIVAGAVLGFLFGEKKKLMIPAACGAVACEAFIAAAVLLWILNQS